MALDPTPKGLGFFMPAEWAPHARCWMAWPRPHAVWGDRLAAAKRGVARLAEAIARFEPVTMIAAPDGRADARAALSPTVEVLEMPLDESWTRDTGPCFLIDGKGGLAGVDFRFNAWGGKYAGHDQDALLARRLLERLDLPRFSSQLTAEGGGLTVDGEGTLITTESCFLNANRNPAWTKAEVERELMQLLGVEKVIWLPGNPEERETDGHVDGIAAFVRPGVVLMERAPDPAAPGAAIMEANVRALEAETDAKGRPLELAFVEEAQSVEADHGRFCRSYVNGYIANGGVVIPCYGIPEDAQALKVYRALFPDREVVQVEITDVAIGGGGIHCMTQQQPAV